MKLPEKFREKHTPVLDKYDRILEKINGLIDYLNDREKKKMIPHICPACYVYCGTLSQPCKSCAGTGIVWSKDEK